MNARVPVWLAAAVVGLVATVPAADPARVVFVVPVERGVSWRDDAFLAAAAAAGVRGDGEPLVCAVDAAAPWRPELVDFLQRFDTRRVVWVGEAAPLSAPGGVELEVVAAADAVGAACAIARSCWTTARQAVVYDAGDRAVALAAAVLAARLGVPLFPGAAETVIACVRELGVQRVVVVGAVDTDGLRGLRIARCADAVEVARLLAKDCGGVDYLAVTHPRDGAPAQSPRLSLAAVLLAAGRGGAVVPLPFETVWKRRHPAGERIDAAPDGAAPSREGWRVGKVELGAGAWAFVNGRGPGGRWWTQVDGDGDGRFDGPGEAPVPTGGVVRLGGTAYVVDVDVDEHARGSALWLTAPAPDDVRGCIRGYIDAVGGEPRYLCLVGWPDAVPLAIVGDGQGIDADEVTDHPYAQTDDDPFVDLAFARFLAEDVASGTLLACRGLAYDDFRQRSWAGTFATAEWEGALRGPLERAGLRHAGHHGGGAPITAGSPLTRVGAIAHGSHAMWTELGSTYKWDSDVLLAPCIVESSGCSTTSIDQDEQRRSVPARMLRNGAVAFVGNGRRGVAQGELYRTELWNALLRQRTLGEAHRDALNRALVAVLEKGQQERGMFRYQFDHVAAYGDPALALDLPAPALADTAHVVARGLRATVVGSPALSTLDYEPLAEWGCASPKLRVWRGLGLGAESWWHGGERRNQEDLLFTAEVRTRRPVVGVEQVREIDAPLGWTGSCYVDEHDDGSRSVFWRCRLVDFDMTTGEVRGSVRRLDFRLRTR